MNILYTLHTAGVLPCYTVTSAELLMIVYGATAVRILAILNRDLKKYSLLIDSIIHYNNNR